MIHRDLCNPQNTKHYSPLRIQFHFVLSRYVCWNGFIPLTRKEMAKLLNCDIQSINKFIKKGVRENILSVQGDRIFLLRRVSEYSEGYVKHFPFLECAEFQALSVHAQRFIMYTLWAGVHTGRPLKRELTALYHSTKELNGVLNLYSRAPIYAILEEAKTFLNIELIHQNEKEMVRVTGLHECYGKQPALENQGEMKLLLNILQANDCDELLSESSRQEILKVKKHYIQKLQAVGMELVSHALQKLLSLHKLFDLNNRGEVGIYLRSILADLEQKIVPTLQKRVEYIKQSIVQTKDKFIHIRSQVMSSFQVKLEKLTQILNSLQSHSTHKNENSSFPFYNWLETEK
jgi:hypothetical protein